MLNDSISLPQNKQEYYVYLIQGERTKFTKIGISNNPEYRLQSLQLGSPDTLFIHSLLRCQSESNARLVERKLHKRFADARIHGEWFQMDADRVYWSCGRKFSRYISVSKRRRTPKPDSPSVSFLDDFAPYINALTFIVMFSSVLVMAAAFISILGDSSNWATWVCLIESVFSFTIAILFSTETVTVNDVN